MIVKLIHLLLPLSIGALLSTTGAVAQLPHPPARAFIMSDDTTEVDTIDRTPQFVLPPGYHPRMRCVQVGSAYLDSIWISDHDLTSITGAPERVTITVLEPAGFVVTPSVILGPMPSDTVKLLLQSGHVPSATGDVSVLIEIRDNEGSFKRLSFPFHTVREPSFTMPVKVSNTMGPQGGASQILTFGIGRDATTGAESGAIGQLDSHYCEFELPPEPPRDVFDARWKVPERLGVLRNIFPESSRDGKPLPPWVAGFNAGDPFNGDGYPVVIEWSMTEAQRAPWGLKITDELADVESGSGIFFVNMQTGAFQGGIGVEVETGFDLVRVTINLSTVRGFKIYRTPSSSVPSSSPRGAPASARITALASRSSSGTTLNYYIPAAADDAAIEIVDARGVTLRTLRLGRREEGMGEIVWNESDERGAPVTSGLYLCRLSAGSSTASCRLIVTR